MSEGCLSAVTGRSAMAQHLGGFSEVRRSILGDSRRSEVRFSQGQLVGGPLVGGQRAGGQLVMPQAAACDGLSVFPRECAFPWDRLQHGWRDMDAPAGSQGAPAAGGRPTINDAANPALRCHGQPSIGFARESHDSMIVQSESQVRRIGSPNRRGFVVRDSEDAAAARLGRGGDGRAGPGLGSPPRESGRCAGEWFKSESRSSESSRPGPSQPSRPNAAGAATARHRRARVGRGAPGIELRISSYMMCCRAIAVRTAGIGRMAWSMPGKLAGKGACGRRAGHIPCRGKGRVGERGM